MSHDALNPSKVTAPEQFESDTQRIVRRHLENQNDVITDEDLRSVRIGVTPPASIDGEETIENDTQHADDEKWESA